MKNQKLPAKNLKHDVVVQKWEESELGWGTRPDGFSLHLTDADRKSFIKAYWDSMPNAVPDEYSRPDGDPYEIQVDDKTFAIVKATLNGCRSYDDAPSKPKNT